MASHGSTILIIASWRKSTILMRLIKFTQAKPLRCVKEQRHQVTRLQAPLPQSALRRALSQQD